MPDKREAHLPQRPSRTSANHLIIACRPGGGAGDLARKVEHLPPSRARSRPWLAHPSARAPRRRQSLGRAGRYPVPRPQPTNYKSKRVERNLTRRARPRRPEASRPIAPRHSADRCSMSDKRASALTRAPVVRKYGAPSIAPTAADARPCIDHIRSELVKHRFVRNRDPRRPVDRPYTAAASLFPSSASVSASAGL
jgi:hypothetical protein